jgi:hypothetical protein
MPGIRYVLLFSFTCLEIREAVRRGEVGSDSLPWAGSLIMLIRLGDMESQEACLYS